MRNRTLLIALWRPLAVRMLLKSQVFQELRKQTWLRIIILTPHSKEERIRSAYAGSNVILEELDRNALSGAQRGSKLRIIFRTVRLFTYRLARVRMVMRDLMMHEYRQRHITSHLSIFARLYFELILFLPRLLGHSRWLRAMWVGLEKLFFARDTHRSVFEKYSPDWMLVSSLGYGYDDQLMWEARRHKTKLISVVQSWDNPSTKGYPADIPDSVIVWSSVMKSEVQKLLDIPANRIFVGGIPHWDIYFKSRKSREEEALFFNELGLDPQKRVIFFPTSAAKMYSDNVLIVRRVVEAITADQINMPVQLLVRPHPGYYERSKKSKMPAIERDLEAIHDLANKYPNIVKLDLMGVETYPDYYDIDVEEQSRLLRRLRYSSVLLNTYSTQAIEAALLDLPIVNTAFGRYKNTDQPNSVLDDSQHFGRLIRTGGIYNAVSAEDMIIGINRYLEDRTLDSVGRRRIVESEIPDNRGEAGVSVATHILKVIR